MLQPTITIVPQALNRSFWMAVYVFIDSVINGRYEQMFYSDFFQFYLNEQALEWEGLSDWGINSSFQIKYKKKDDREDFTELVAYYRLCRGFPKNDIILTIDIDELSLEQQDRYIFKYSDFFRFIKHRPEIERITFQNEKYVDKSTGDIRVFRTTRLRRNRNGEKYLSSRKYIPIIEITELNYHLLFDPSIPNSSQDGEYGYIKEAIQKLQLELKRNISIPLELIDKSLFGQWFTYAYLLYLQRTSGNIESSSLGQLLELLRIYVTSISELAQNIVFHTDNKYGLIYVVFYREEELSDVQRIELGLNESSKSDYTIHLPRYVEIGIFDFNRAGIKETFVRGTHMSTNVSLADFFTHLAIPSNVITHLDFRRIAHLGLSIFTATISRYHGYFRVESGHNSHKQWIELRDGSFSTTNSCNFVDGTQYDILLPVVLSEEKVPVYSNLTQKASGFNKILLHSLQVGRTIRRVFLKDYLDSPEGLDVTGQLKRIQQIADAIRRRNSGLSELAIDISDTSEKISTIIKLLVLLQTSGEEYYSSIILCVPSDQMIDEICEVVKRQLLDSPFSMVWNDSTAIVIMGKDLRFQIFTGKSREDFYAANTMFQHYYYASRNYFKESYNPVSNTFQQFILPYELLIEDNGTYPYFIQYLYSSLKFPIEGAQMGYRVDMPTYIGNKLIVKNYYEADLVFQNSFFVDRFAFLISKKIISSNLSGISSIALIGYKSYSEQLIKKIATFFLKLMNWTVQTIVVEEDLDGHLSVNEKKDIKILPEALIVTVVPIGATLSTNDKIASFLKEKYEVPSGAIIHNHCSIVVRDSELSMNCTILEIAQKWHHIDKMSHVVYTDFEHAQSVHYDILLGYSNPSLNNWLPRINSEISFRGSFAEESYVNDSENASINSQHLLGLPRVDDYFINGAVYNHLEELSRLISFKPFIYSGHIEYNGSHHRFYLDTEAFIKEKGNQFDEWLEAVYDSGKRTGLFSSDYLNILVTPNPRIDSSLVNRVNDILFKENAIILCVDVKSWRNNVVKKLSYLKELQGRQGKEIRYFFVDHSISTATAYHRTVSFLHSIDSGISFSGAIVMVNRTHRDTYKDICEDFQGGGRVFTFLNLFVPEIADAQNQCLLCALNLYYDNLQKVSVTKECIDIITDNRERMKLESLFPIGRHIQVNSNRRFLRLFFAHEIYYRCAKLKDQSVEYALNPLFDGLFTEKDVADSVLVLINRHYDDALDKQISFLKAISSPPLSRYILIRTYAQSKLLTVLERVLKAPNRDYNLFRLMEAVLKSLSFLNSNALVRKDVILGSWKICDDISSFVSSRLRECESRLLYLINSINQSGEKGASLFDVNEKESILQEIETLSYQLKRLKQFGGNFLFYIKNAIFQDGSKSLYLGELMRTGKEIDLSHDNTQAPIRISKTILKNEFNNHFEDTQKKGFIENLYYENTAIIRKALDNFERELLRNHALQDCYYLKKGSNRQLLPFIRWEEQIETIAVIFKDIVKKGYYYSDFVPYLTNGDSFDYIDKIICLLYLRLRFRQLKSQKGESVENNGSIEHDLTEILSGLTYLMQADYSLYAVGEENEVYVLDYNPKVLGEKQNHYAVGRRYPNDSYVNKLFVQADPSPEISIEKNPLSKSDFEYEDGKRYLFACTFVIQPQFSSKRKQLISFFYNSCGNDDSFFIRTRESARLLLLLRREMYGFFVDFLLKEKVVDLWIDKIEGDYKFEKIYQESAHVFNSVFEEMKEFESLDMNELPKMAHTWYWLTNETISYLYSNIEKNRAEDGKNRFVLDKGSDILSGEDTIKDVFCEAFICLVSQLLKERWDSQYCSITINGESIERFSNANLPDSMLKCRKQIIQSFIVQCLNNSLGAKSRHGHRRGLEKKQAIITVSKDTIIIEDHVISEGYSPEDLLARAKKFEYKAEQIRTLNCKHYSSTTLTAIQGFTCYMKENGKQYDFAFGFKDNRDFCIKIKFGEYA